MYQRILVPVDGSAPSKRALEEAISVAKMTGAQVRVVHVIDEPFMAMGVDGFSGSPGDIVELMQEAGRRIVGDAVAKVRAAGVACDSALADSLHGRVCDLVVDAARTWQANLIVIGTHGRHGVARAVLGSDAEQMLRVSPVPVLLVHEGTPLDAAPAGR